MKKTSTFFSATVLMLVLFFPLLTQAVTKKIIASMTWATAITTYSILTTDDVIIQNGATVTVTADATIKSVQLGNNSAPSAGTGTLTFNNGKKLIVNGSFKIGDSAGRLGTLNMSSGGYIYCNDLSAATSFTSFSPGSGTIEIKTGSTLPSNIATYYNLVNNSAGILRLACNITVNGNLDVTSGIFQTTSTSDFDVTVGGVLTIASGQEFKANGSIITLRGNFINNGTYTYSTSSTVFDGTTVISGSTSPTFYNVTVNSGKSVTLPSACTIANNWTNNGGTVSPGTGTVTFSSNIAQAINGTATSQTFYNLTINKTGGTVTVGGSATTLNVNDYTQTAGNFTASTNMNMNVTGNWTNSAGTFTHSNGTVTFNGTGSQSLAGATTTFYKLTVNKSAGTLTQNASTATVNNMLTMTSGTFNVGTKTLNGTGSVTATGGDLQMALLSTTLPQLSGSSYNITGGTITLNGAGVQTLRPSITYYNVVLATSGVKTICNVTSILNDLTISGTATFTCNAGLVVGGTLSYNCTSGTTTLTASTPISVGSFSQSNGGVFVDNGNTITVTGASFNRTGGTFTATGKVIFNSSGAQSIGGSIATTFNKLYHSGSGTLTLGVNTTVNGVAGVSELNISAGIVNASAFTFSGNADVNMTGGELQLAKLGTSLPEFTGTYTLTAGTVTFNGAGSQTIKALDYYNLNLAGSGAKTFLTSLVIVRGAITKGSGVTADLRTNTVNMKYNGTGVDANQSVLALDYYSLTFGNVGVKTFASGTTRIQRSFTSTGGTGDALTNQSTLEFDGTSNQFLNGSTVIVSDFYNLTVSNTASSGLNLQWDGVNLHNSMTLGNAANFTNTSHPLTFKSNATSTARLLEVPANAHFFGNIIMERWLPHIDQDPDNGGYWHMMGAPISGTGFKGIRYNEANLNQNMNIGYYPCVSPTNNTCPTALDPTEGGFRSFGTLAQLFTYDQGPPNIGSFSRSISSTPSGNDPADGWNLVTNPYPCEILWNQFGIDINNVGKAAYIVDYENHYLSFLMDDLKTMAAGQAFWVKVTGSGSNVTGSINFREPSKANSSTSQVMHRMAAPAYPHLVLKMINSAGGYDLTDVRFQQGATSNIDPDYDAYKIGGYSAIPFMYTLTDDNIKASINSFPELTQNYSVQVVAQCINTGVFTMQVDNLSGFPASSCIFLEDLVTNTFYDLKTTSSFTFDVTGGITDVTRFVLHFGPPVEMTLTDAACSAGNYSGAALATPLANGPWTYTWKDGSGNIVRTTPSSSQPDSLTGVVAGNYTLIVTNTSGNCATVTEPITIGGFAPIASNAVVTAASCFGTADGAIDLAPSGGLAPFTFNWSNSASSEDISGVVSGSYSVTITDANNCAYTQPIVVSSPPQITPAFSLSASTVYLSAGATVIFSNNSTGATSYLWNFGDGSPVSTAANPAHPFLSSGVFTTSLTASNGTCSSVSQQDITVLDAPNGINSNDLSSQVSVFTSEGNLMIDFNLPETNIVNVSVVDMLGQTLWSVKDFKARDNAMIVNLNYKPQGVYLVQIAFPQNSIAKKVFFNK